MDTFSSCIHKFNNWDAVWSRAPIILVAMRLIISSVVKPSSKFGSSSIWSTSVPAYRSFIYFYHLSAICFLSCKFSPSLHITAFLAQFLFCCFILFICWYISVIVSLQLFYFNAFSFNPFWFSSLAFSLYFCWNYPVCFIINHTHFISPINQIHDVLVLSSMVFFFFSGVVQSPPLLCSSVLPLRSPTKLDFQELPFAQWPFFHIVSLPLYF